MAKTTNATATLQSADEILNAFSTIENSVVADAAAELKKEQAEIAKNNMKELLRNVQHRVGERVAAVRQTRASTRRAEDALVALNNLVNNITKPGSTAQEMQDAFNAGVSKDQVLASTVGTIRCYFS